MLLLTPFNNKTDRELIDSVRQVLVPGLNHTQRPSTSCTHQSRTTVHPYFVGWATERRNRHYRLDRCSASSRTREWQLRHRHELQRTHCGTYRVRVPPNKIEDGMLDFLGPPCSRSLQRLLDLVNEKIKSFSLSFVIPHFCCGVFIDQDWKTGRHLDCHLDHAARELDVSHRFIAVLCASFALNNDLSQGVSNRTPQNIAADTHTPYIFGKETASASFLEPQVIADQQTAQPRAHTHSR
jgi:hypothetical protein